MVIPTSALQDMVGFIFYFLGLVPSEYPVLLKLAPTFMRPKGILAYINVPHGVVKVVFF